MKKAVIFLALLLGYSSSAQIDIGLRAGAGLSSPQIENFEESSSIRDLESADSEISYQIGIYSKVKLAAFFIQGELYFTQINQSAIASFTVANLPSKNIDLSFSRLSLPILLGLELGPIRIMGGPTFSSNFDDVTGNLNNDLQGSSLSYQVGLGVDFNSMFIDLRYEAGLGNWANKVNIDNRSYQADMSVTQLMLCIGFELF